MAVQIIGRRDELLTLGAFLTDIPAGGQALLLEGDAGIGKTALWQEGLRDARERGIQVLQACPSNSEAQIAFAALGDLVTPVLGPVLPQLVPMQRRALETALLLRESEGAPPDVRVLGLALLSIMRTLAQERPVLVAIDDHAVARRELCGCPHVRPATAGSRADRRFRDGARAPGRGAARARPGLFGFPPTSRRAALGRRNPPAPVGSSRARTAPTGSRPRAPDHRR